MERCNPHGDNFLRYCFQYWADSRIDERPPYCCLEWESNENHAFELALDIPRQLLTDKEIGLHLNKFKRKTETLRNTKIPRDKIAIALILILHDTKRTLVL